MDRLNGIRAANDYLNRKEELRKKRLVIGMIAGAVILGGIFVVCQFFMLAV